jgi:hypothetical protein
MEDNEAMNGSHAYTVARLATDISNAVWSEVDSPMPQIDVYRRQLQRSYLKLMDEKINGPVAISSDLRSIERDDIKKLAHRLDKAIPLTKDSVTRAHLETCRTDTERILENKYNAPSGGLDLDLLAMLLGYKPEDLLRPVTEDECWAPDVTIRQAVQEVLAQEKGHAAPVPAPAEAESTGN